MRTTVSFLIVLALACAGCSSSDDVEKDSGPDKDQGAEVDKGADPDKAVEDKGADDQGDEDAAPPAGFELTLEVWQMNEVAGGKNMFDKNKKDGEEQMGLTFETIEAGDGAIIANDAGWIAYGYRGAYVYYIVAKTANDSDKLKEDTIALIKHLAGKLPETATGKVETLLPGDDEVAGWVENTEVGKAGVESAYTDGEIEDIINGHHAPYATEGTAGFAKQDYMK